MAGSTVSHNDAEGGKRNHQNNDGQGIGGGIYNLGAFTFRYGDR